MNRSRLASAVCLLLLAAVPVLWASMREYQKARVFTFLNPETDPLGTGYNIIQSKIAIGSGGLFGKGWLNGTQSHLEFLPERSTDLARRAFRVSWFLETRSSRVGRRRSWNLSRGHVSRPCISSTIT